MRSENWTGFSGVSGRVVSEAFGFGTLVSGMAIMLVMFLMGKVVAQAGAFVTVVPLLHALIAVVLARHALAGAHGEYGGWVFTSAGGSWSDVLAVAGRFLALTAIWLAPLMVFGSDELASQIAMSMMMGRGLGAAGNIGMIYMLLFSLTPPVFLAVSVSAGSFGEIFSTAHWARLFSGRIRDLKLIYILYLGSMVLAALLAMPLLTIVGARDPRAGMFLFALFGTFLVGLMTAVLGRLAGFFALGEPEGELPGATAPSDPIVASFDASVPVPAGTPDSIAPSDDPLTAGKPPLEDARGVVTQALQEFQVDPERAMAMLEEARENHMAHPQVLHALARMRVERGQDEQAVEVGREALSVCIDKGAMPMAAQLLNELWPLMGRLQPSREQLVAIAGSMVPDGDLMTATKAFAVLIKNDPTDAKAIKGLMKIADLKLHKRAAPTEARKLYRFLVQHCADSPLAEYFRRGLEEAERAA